MRLSRDVTESWPHRLPLSRPHPLSRERVTGDAESLPGSVRDARARLAAAAHGPRRTAQVARPDHGSAGKEEEGGVGAHDAGVSAQSKEWVRPLTRHSFTCAAACYQLSSRSNRTLQGRAADCHMHPRCSAECAFLVGQNGWLGRSR